MKGRDGVVRGWVKEPPALLLLLLLFFFCHLGRTALDTAEEVLKQVGQFMP